MVQRLLLVPISFEQADEHEHYVLSAILFVIEKKNLTNTLAAEPLAPPNDIEIFDIRGGGGGQIFTEFSKEKNKNYNEKWF